MNIVRRASAPMLLLILLALLLAGCVEMDSALSTPTPAPTATTRPIVTATPVATIAASPAAATPTVLVDVLSLLPQDYQPLAVQRADLDGDGVQEWVVLAGKPGQPTFETVQPMVMGQFGGVARILWRGQADFAVTTSGDLRVEDLTGDGRPEIIYSNRTSLGGSYAFVYGGSAKVTDHQALPPVGGVLGNVGFFSGWALEFLPPGADGKRAISSIINLAGTRQLYRWDGEGFKAGETLQGTPLPAGLAISTPEPSDPEAVDPTHDLPGSTIVDKIIGDIDGDGVPEISTLYTSGNSADLEIAIFSYLAPPGFPPAYGIAWTSGPLAGSENQVFKLRDLTGDGRMELLSGQGGGVAGVGTLYTVGSQNGVFGFIRAVGGRFDGRDSLGDGDYVVEDQGTGLAPLIYARYDEGARSDVYRWADGVFKFLRTQ